MRTPSGIMALAAAIRAGSTALAAIACVALAGCAAKPGPIFPALAEPVFWPQPPDPARIHYVGALETDQDLRPGRSLFGAVGEALFGKASARSMLTPYAIAGDGEDRIFVCDSNAQLVHVFDLRTRRYDQWKVSDRGSRARDVAGGDAAPGGGGLSQPVGIAYDPRGGDRAGRLLVADPVEGGVFVFDDRGGAIGWIGRGLLTRPTGLAADPARDRILVADAGAHELVALSRDGRVLARVGARGTGPGEFNFPTSVAVDADGNVYVSDSLNARVQVFNAELRPVGQIGRRGNRPGYFSHPKGLAVDPYGHLYVVDAHFEAIQIFSAAGDLLLSFGREGHGPGEFWLPAGVFTTPDGRIWVADAYNRRVQVFEYRPPADAPEPMHPVRGEALHHDPSAFPAEVSP